MTRFNNPFEKLAALKDQLPPGKAPKAPKEPPRKLVVHYERKGHGGKECTRISQFARTEEEAATLVKALKQELGCGGYSEGKDIVLQGDQRERLKKAASLL